MHVHHGTREVLGRVLLMDAEALRPGESGLAQVRLEEPLAPRYDDRFIVRSYSPVYTIGGGVVLDALPPRRTTLKPHERELLDALLAHDLASAATGLLGLAALPMTSAEVAAALGVPRVQVADELNRANLERLKVGGETYFVTAEALDASVEAIERELLAFHAEDTARDGDRDRSRCATASTGGSSRASSTRSSRWRSSGVSRSSEKGQVRHPKAAASALADEAAAAAALLSRLEAAGLAPPAVGELAEQAGIDAAVARKVLGKLAAEQRVVRVTSDLHFSLDAIHEARDKLVGALQAAPAGLTAAELRDVLGVSRKYAIPLLEFVDAQGVTRREGDLRMLRRG